MLGSRCYNKVANMTHGAFGFHSSLNRVIGGLSNRLYYSEDKGYKCCENIPQTSGKKVEPWPKADPPPPMWRCECPQDPQPPNYDPYRIKVPDVVVPPLPPSNAKWNGVLLTTTDQPGPEQEQYQQQQQQQQQQQGGPETFNQQHGTSDESSVEKVSLKSLIKGFFGRWRGKTKGEGESMMLDHRQYPIYQW